MKPREARMFATDTVLRAGDMARAAFGRVRKEFKQSDVSFDVVTEADRTIDTFIRNEIAKAYPDHTIRSEEHVPTIGVSEYAWTIDPIDGSSNFAQSIPHFAICVGVMRGIVPFAGALTNPVTDELFSFSEEEGAFLGEGIITANTTAVLPGSTILLTIGSRRENTSWGLSLYGALVETEARVRNFGSSALDLAYLAAGRVDAVIYGGITLADVVPAVGLVRSAGGDVYNFETGAVADLLPTPQRIVAAGTPELAHAIRALATL